MITVLNTQRLTLRVPRVHDLTSLIQLRTDPEVMEFIGCFRRVQTVEEIQEQVSLAYEYHQHYGLGFFCAFETKTGRFIGQAGLFHLSFNTQQPDIELAYRLLPEFWGQGYATELAQALVQWGLTHFNFPCIIAPVHPDNIRSIRVLEKAGLQTHRQINYKGHRIPCYEIKRSLPSPQDIIQHNHTQYNRIAPLWNQNRNHFTQPSSIEQLTIDQCIALLPSGASILDLGCGNGKPIAHYLLQHGFDVTGLDIAETLIDCAKTIIPEHRLICGDYLTTPIDATFDAIVCWCMLFHLHQSQHPLALTAMANQLKPNGILAINFADTSSPLNNGSIQRIDDDTILSTQFGHTFYHSGQPARYNRERVIHAGFDVITDRTDTPGNQVIIARKKT